MHTHTYAAAMSPFTKNTHLHTQQHGKVELLNTFPVHLSSGDIPHGLRHKSNGPVRLPALKSFLTFSWLEGTSAQAHTLLTNVSPASLLITLLHLIFLCVAFTLHVSHPVQFLFHDFSSRKHFKHPNMQLRLSFFFFCKGVKLCL